MRLDLLLIRRHPGLSRRKARDVIEKGQVDVDGVTVREAGRAVSDSTRVEWDPHRRAGSRVRLELPTLYQDDRLLIVDKPAGLLSVPTRPGTAEDSVARRVHAYARRLRPRQPYARVVHRLDRDTSGALAVALDARTADALRALFRAHRVERRYLALVAGTPRQAESTIELPIRDLYVGGRRAVAREGEPAKPARTHFRVLERFHGAALLEVALDTGRQHQIRVHLAHLRLPVLGDEVYGDARPRPPLWPARQMLHAHVLGFAHPATGEAVRVESPVPDDLQQALRAQRALTRSRSRPGSP